MEIITGTPEPDELFALQQDTLRGGAGNDTLDATGAEGRNWLFGQEGDDLLLAGSRDILVGGAGDDQMFVGTGGAVLVGGAGADGFLIFNGELPSRVNVVRDFTQGEDVLGLRGMSEADFRSLRVSTINETDTLVQLAGENVAILRGVEAQTLTRDDFFVASPGIEPVIGISVEPDSIAEGESTTISISLSEPAPEGGLEVAWTEVDSDEALGDIELLLDESTNILEFEGLADGDVPTGAVVTIAPGATEATVVFSANEDEIEEDPETTTYTLQPGSGYVVDPENNSDTLTITDEPTAADSLLDEILERGFLRVAVTGDSVGLDFRDENGIFSGLSVDMSRAIATALFDDPDAIEFVVVDFNDGFDAVAQKEVDLGAISPTQNVTRDGTLGIDYSPIIFYDGQGLLVRADSGITEFSDLEGLTIGVGEGFVDGPILEDALGDAGIEANIEALPNQEALFAAYDAGELDAVSIARGILSGILPRLSNPTNHLILDEVLSKQPLGLLVPENESQWADVVRWVVNTTFQAEEFGITSENVEEFLDSDDPAIRRFLGTEGDFGEALGLENDFTVQVISEVGNYEEIYFNNFRRRQDVFPRGLNRIQSEGGLIYSLPFSGEVPSLPSQMDDDRNVLEEVLDRGFVIVGVNDTQPGLNFIDADGELSGMTVDFGRAIAAAVFGDPEAVEFRIQEFSERINEVADGTVDLSASPTTHNIVRDGALGVDFSVPYLYEGQSLLVPGDGEITELADIAGETVGTVAGSNSLEILTTVFEETGETFASETFETTSDMLAAYDAGEIDAVFFVRTILGSSIPSLSNRGDSVLLDEVLSKDPLALIVDENQSDWSDIVNWVVYTTIQAEEFGITSENVTEFLDSDDAAIRRFLGVEGNLGESLGLSDDFAVNVISAVGNYGEIYEGNLDTAILPRGLNDLFTDGGLQYSPPFG